jgi:probable phosphomutase (TIGR03848 family)
MPTLLLIRHGENDFVKEDRLPGRLPGIHLNERGQAQAAALAESVKSLPVRAVYASPLERAVETASPLALALGLEVQLRPGLLDTDVGEWQGLLFKKLRKLPLWKQVQEQPSEVRFPGGESFLELQERLVREIETIRAAQKRNDMLALVFHCDPIKLVLAHYIGLPLNSFQKFVVAPGSVSVLVLGRSAAHLAALNLKPPFKI